MKKNIALNVFYTLGIVVSVVGLKWAYQAHNFPVVGVLVATTLFFLYLKIRIVKDVRSSIQDKEKSIRAAGKDEQR
jgi:hypothetical protein